MRWTLVIVAVGLVGCFEEPSDPTVSGTPTSSSTGSPLDSTSTMGSSGSTPTGSTTNTTPGSTDTGTATTDQTSATNGDTTTTDSSAGSSSTGENPASCAGQGFTFPTAPSYNTPWSVCYFTNDVGNTTDVAFGLNDQVLEDIDVMSSLCTAAAGDAKFYWGRVMSPRPPAVHTIDFRTDSALGPGTVVAECEFFVDSP